MAQQDVASTGNAVRDAQTTWIGCQERLASDPTFGDLHTKIRLSTHDEVSIEQRANESKPTSQEVRELESWDKADQVCRVAYVEAARQSFPYEVDAIEASYSMIDAIYLDLAKGSISWGEANTRLAASKPAIRKMMVDATTPYVEQKEAENQQELAQRQAVWNGVGQVVGAVAQAYVETRPITTTCSGGAFAATCTTSRGW